MATPVDNSSVFDTAAEQAPLVVIVGPTASGKSALAMELAKAFDGEIICADSRTVYKNMDIGTAKPSVQDQAEVPHWGLDLVEPGEVFTAADFKKYALQKAQQVRERGHVPFLVGGTGLYVDGIIFDYEFGKPQPELRKQLELLSLEELKLYCSNNNIELPKNENNRRYVIRAIEQNSVNRKRLRRPIDNVILVGITTERDILRDRIQTRSEQLFENSMLEEAIELGEKYGWNSEAMTGNIYKLVRRYLNKELSLDELKQANFHADWQLAKRQMTYMKRNEFIHWLTLDEAREYITNALKS
jgi:tRNA dimethylallyltransferase